MSDSPRSWFPQEIYVCILSQLPVLRHSTSSTDALSNCAASCSVLRAAATSPGLWKPHYEVRYTHCRPVEEERRNMKWDGDWRMMFLERGRLDRRACAVVEDLVLCKRRHRDDKSSDVGYLPVLGDPDRHGQGLDTFKAMALVHECAQTMVSLGLDVFDALDILEKAPVPECFKTDDEPPLEEEEEAVPEARHVAAHALPRRYWADSMRRLILRHDAVSLWVRIGIDGGYKVSMERAIAGFSAFFGVTYEEIRSMLDDLAQRCGQQLLSLGVELDPDGPNYNLAAVCVQICSFMRDEGFGPLEGVARHQPADLFPHRFLSSTKRNIPMGLVYVFVSICRRLGIAASPTDFPGCVLAHVSSPDPAVSDIFVDVFGSADKAILSLAEDIPTRLAMARVPLNALMRCISPCGADSSMLRQAKNIFNGFQRQNGGPHPPAGEIEATFYAAACAFTIFSHEDLFINELAVIEPLDVKAIQLDLICDALLPNIRDQLKAACSKRLVAEVLENAVSLRSQLQARPKYFVGMFFTYTTPDRIGCIIGWKSKGQVAKDQTLNFHNEYSFISETGFQDMSAVSEDIIDPFPVNTETVRRLVRSGPRFGKYFEDVEIDPNGSGRGRMVMSPAMKRQFPDDDEAGRRWVAEGSV